MVSFFIIGIILTNITQVKNIIYASESTGFILIFVSFFYSCLMLCVPPHSLLCLQLCSAIVALVSRDL